MSTLPFVVNPKKMGPTEFMLKYAPSKDHLFNWEPAKKTRSQVAQEWLAWIERTENAVFGFVECDERTAISKRQTMTGGTAAKIAHSSDATSRS